MIRAHDSNTSDRLLPTLAAIEDLQHMGRPIILGIDGRSGSGKTRYGAALAQASDLRVCSFEVEDFIGGWGALTRDIGRVADITAEIKGGGTAYAERWDWHAGRFSELVRLPEPADARIVLVVGCGSTSAKMRPHLDLTVWLEAPERVRRARVCARDSYDWSEYWDAWAAQEAELLAECPSHLNADIVVDGSS